MHELKRLLAVLTLGLAACGSPGDDGAADTSGASDSTTANADADGVTVVVCSPGTATCDGVARMVCREDGTRWDRVTCPTGSGCEGGSCRPQVCTPLASSGECTDDASYERCNVGGTGYEQVTCNAGESCRNGACAGPICVPGQRICAGFSIVEQCAVGGLEWQQAETCAAGSACADGVCVSPCDLNIKNGSYLGCEYFAVDLDNVEEAETQPVGLVVSVPSDGVQTEVHIYATATGDLLTSAVLGVSDLFVSPGQVKSFRLPTGYDIDGTGLSLSSFRVETTSPVTVHQFNPLNGEGVYSNDASLLLPSQVVSGHYIVMSWPHRQDEIATLRGFATIIATYAGGTEVQVTPSAKVAAGLGIPAISAGQTRKFQLAQGQVLNLETAGDDTGDLTGTIITANRSISVIAGHECANVPAGISACDHIESQLFPVEAWGTRYVADAFKQRSPAQVDVWRVMGGANGVTVETDPPVAGYERFELQRGTWVQFASTSSFEIVADGPVLVGHYLSGSAYPGANKVCNDNGFGATTGLGDPAFTLPVPTSRFLKRYAVLTPSGYQENYLNVVARTGTELALDDEPLDASFVSIGSDGWGLARIPVSPGVHAVTGSNAFGLTAYGYSCDVSYAYPGGLQLERFQEFR
ncbi:MAG: IgGFc-binding protein [Deltaproteobacteria bacterium]|nr:IgGFc-binding protein [Deltaproteobacteria bacterium]